MLQSFYHHDLEYMYLETRLTPCIKWLGNGMLYCGSIFFIDCMLPVIYLFFTCFFFFTASDIKIKFISESYHLLFIKNNILLLHFVHLSPDHQNKKQKPLRVLHLRTTICTYPMRSLRWMSAWFPCWTQTQSLVGLLSVWLPVVHQSCGWQFLHLSSKWGTSCPQSAYLVQEQII